LVSMPTSMPSMLRPFLRSAPSRGLPSGAREVKLWELARGILGPVRLRRECGGRVGHDRVGVHWHVVKGREMSTPLPFGGEERVLFGGRDGGRQSRGAAVKSTSDVTSPVCSRNTRVYAGLRVPPTL
jgi:hypothetical protein